MTPRRRFVWYGRGLLVVMPLLAACNGGGPVATNDPSAVMHLATGAKVPIPVSCRVRPDRANANASAALVDATLRNVSSKQIIGVDLTVLDGAATSTFVPLALAPGKSTLVHRSLALTAAPSAHATCTLSLIQYADKSGWQFSPATRSQ